MAKLMLEILDKDANILHRENYAWSRKKGEMIDYLNKRANVLLNDAKSMGLSRAQPASFRILER